MNENSKKNNSVAGELAVALRDNYLLNAVAENASLKNKVDILSTVKILGRDERVYAEVSFLEGSFSQRTTQLVWEMEIKSALNWNLEKKMVQGGFFGLQIGTTIHASGVQITKTRPIRDENLLEVYIGTVGGHIGGCSVFFQVNGLSENVWNELERDRYENELNDFAIDRSFNILGRLFDHVDDMDNVTFTAKKMQFGAYQMRDMIQLVDGDEEFEEQKLKLFID